uniref:WAT1-related protein n=1 Tax=Macrostomum lignano TaxID=282301 RepID=A0A1I8FC76_9PLAT
TEIKQLELRRTLLLRGDSGRLKERAAVQVDLADTTWSCRRRRRTPPKLGRAVWGGKNRISAHLRWLRCRPLATCGRFPYLCYKKWRAGPPLPGAAEGVKFYLTPVWSRLADYKVWMEAATQIFFSLSCCNGGLIAMSSYNINFRNNCQRDAVMVALINCGTSVFAGLVIFCNLGFMSHQKNVPVGEVAKGGPGLAFIVYPEALTHMPLSPL